ncbi:MAG: hypothetical protein KIT16_14665 [Rhodospirillaceae bacterium]|nr:hypothetical protein [Rhodospirillaceae bacterium]
MGRVVAAIRADYVEIAGRIAGSEKKKRDDTAGVGIVRTETVVNHDREPWRAVGIYRIVYTFWSHEVGPVGGRFPQRLRKATVNAEISARRYYQEFFYDAAGRFVFYYRRGRDGETPAELRVYYRDGRPIRVIADGTTRDAIAADDLKRARETVAKADTIRRLFDQTMTAPVE